MLHCKCRCKKYSLKCVEFFYDFLLQTEIMPILLIRLLKKKPETLKK